ncbi:hypothetical protein V1527DRAFT_460926 [Lipomyces starkeyi]
MCVRRRRLIIRSMLRLRRNVIYSKTLVACAISLCGCDCHRTLLFSLLGPVVAHSTNSEQ